MHGCASHVETRDRIAAPLAEAHQPGMEAHAKRDRISRRSNGLAVALNIPGGNTSPFGVVLECAWPSENGDAAVTSIVNDHAASALDRIADMREPMVQECLGVVGIAGRDVTGRTHHVHGENGDDVALRGRGTSKGHRLGPSALATRKVNMSGQHSAISHNGAPCEPGWVPILLLANNAKGRI